MFKIIILIVEDDVGLCEVFLDIFLLGNYEVVVVDCVEEVLMVLFLCFVDLVVSDI